MAGNRRKALRRPLSYQAKIVAIDGSWGRNCEVVDISDTGAKLRTSEPLELPADFILALSMRGKANRRCHVAWCEGCEIGATFVGREPSKINDAPPRLVSG